MLSRSIKEESRRISASSVSVILSRVEGQEHAGFRFTHLSCRWSASAVVESYGQRRFRMNPCNLCGSQDTWYSKWRKQWVCTPCFQKKEMIGKCPSCGGWLGQVEGVKTLFLLSKTECASCYRSPFTAGGWRKDPESPLAIAIKKGADVITGTIIWGSLAVLGVLAAIIAIGLYGGITGVQVVGLMDGLDSIAPPLGSIIFWAPVWILLGWLALTILLKKRS